MTVVVEVEVIDLEEEEEDCRVVVVVVEIGARVTVRHQTGCEARLSVTFRPKISPANIVALKTVNRHLIVARPSDVVALNSKSDALRFSADTPYVDVLPTSRSSLSMTAWCVMMSVGHRSPNEYSDATPKM